MRLLSLFAVIAVVLLTVGQAQKTETVDVSIGQLFEFGLTNDQIDPRPLPVWMGFDQDERQIFGVPRWDHLENVTLLTQNGLKVEVITKAEIEPCESSQDYIFIEVYDDKDLTSYSLADLRSKIKEFAEIYDVKEEQVRAFTSSELEKYRTVTSSGISSDYIARPDQLVLWIRLGCGDFYDIAETSTYEIAEEQRKMDKNLRVGQGQVQKDNVLAFQTATPASASRTTRALIDLKPVLYNKINTIKCKRGIICQKWLPFNTFTDEDGMLVKLRPKVFSSGDHPNFLNITYQKNTVVLEGVGLEIGTFNFRLEVRDHLNQVNDAPFVVEIEETPKANHLFLMHMKSRIQKFRDQPSLLTLFVRRLITYVGGKSEDVLIDSLETDEGPDSSILKWSNHSFSRKTCQQSQINETKSKMLNAKQAVSHQFRKAMGAEFHLSSIEVEMLDTCAPGASTIQISNIRASTHLPPKGSSEDDSGLSTSLLISLIAITVLLLLAIFILIFFCFQRKRPAHKMKKNSSEYAAKGHPIVFPDEVPLHEDEGATATATQPMLIHENPPLNPATSEPSTTTHDNPSYKPPVAPGAQRLPTPSY